MRLTFWITSDPSARNWRTVTVFGANSLKQIHIVFKTLFRILRCYFTYYANQKIITFEGLKGDIQGVMQEWKLRRTITRTSSSKLNFHKYICNSIETQKSNTTFLCGLEEFSLLTCYVECLEPNPWQQNSRNLHDRPWIRRILYYPPPISMCPLGLEWKLFKARLWGQRQ
jgi:hypothetical protein